MTVLLIPDKFKGSLTAIEVIAALTKGIKRADNKIDILQVIASDGGDGFLDAIRHTMDVEEISCSTVDPLGRKTSTWSVTRDYVFHFNTLEEVAATHVITRERVRQMLHKALREYKKRNHT